MCWLADTFRSHHWKRSRLLRESTNSMPPDSCSHLQLVSANVRTISPMRPLAAPTYHVFRTQQLVCADHTYGGVGLCSGMAVTSSSMGAPGMGAANEPSAAPQAPRPKPIPKQLEPLPPGSWNWTSYNSDWNGPALPYYDYHVRDPRWGGGVVGNVTPPANPNLNF